MRRTCGNIYRRDRNGQENFKQNIQLESAIDIELTAFINRAELLQLVSKTKKGARRLANSS
jgi:hypothetical protein